ncbi:MAG: hypothetical protein GXO08_04290 [Aquificae bacterium]|nr:hypothetical protein [Aquificota bacterium]
MREKTLSDIEREYLRKITTLEEFERFLEEVENHLRELEEDLRLSPYLSKREKFANHLLAVNLFLILSDLSRFVEESRDLEDADDELKPVLEEFLSEERRRLSEVVPLFRTLEKLPDRLEDRILRLAEKASRLEELHAALTEGLLDEGPFDGEDEKPALH